MINKLKYIILKPITLSIFLGLVVIAFLPDFFEKYEIDIIPVDLAETMDTKIVHTFDMDSDSMHEYVVTYNYQDKHSIQVITNDGGIVDQWNTRVNIPQHTQRIAIGDYDKDGYGEFYSFGDRNDSLFLYAYEPLDTLNPLWIKNRFLFKLSRKFNTPDYVFNSIEIRDITSDGNPDIFFIINSGQARIPRNICVYDIVHDTLIISPTYGTVPMENIFFIKTKDEYSPVIFGNTQAAGQIDDSLGIIYSDYSAWIMAFNNELDLIFKPIEFKGFRSIVKVKHVRLNEIDYILALYNHQGKEDNYPKLILVDLNGRIHREYTFSKSNKKDRWINVDRIKNPHSFYMVCQTGKIIEFDTTLTPVDSLTLDHEIKKGYTQDDLNEDGNPEKIFIVDNNKLLITQSNFRFPLVVDLDGNIMKFEKVNTSGNTYLFVQMRDDEVLIKYSKNPLYIFKYGIYIGIILVIYSFITLVRRLQLIQIKKKERIRRQIFELQLKSFRNQMDPHFTLNVFNTIAHKIHKESPESYDAFMEFASLIRKTLVASDSITRSIAEEVSKLESYLKLEQMRYGEKISYDINIGDDVNQSSQIPKLILQTYVENAIKHGIRPKETPGKVTVDIYLNSRNLNLEISDDGIGRKKSRELKTQGTGFGMNIMKNYFALYNESNRSKIKQQIIDIDNGEDTGTRVIVSIPTDFKYTLGTK